ncbi:ParB/RepB/Spo0J family partition protein [Moraxella catarrhalis]|jgi:ParB family chromosome partitioning protein|uniref:ParB/RepB/Spo0J family partition protein n=1 Tax=Moraxella catarrhalis TaxID=480 RepID=UPI0009C2985D|nr:ParB/RepB/Spo0J family partition protein [Moraxella catarrhalis]ARE67005.1 hypothetical protein MC195_09525 [Moraxella catarrhalis]MPW68399.1 ParB/RepB/Spo0J family partition protein [Moraxella catarrhalis]MPX28264.1 hypothetical protein [Moraxella catarrhalis]MPX57049.1 ParB/RepB/Spo0J family partition protein [Moraxella catarrhalis]MPX68908.1 ParB/RepB/Spo0J family partition protein [Moraxella catarrhalis]
MNDKLATLNLGGLLNKPVIGQVSEIDISLIAEDSLNARREFHDDTLHELAQSIKEHGVISPISLRANPIKDGYYIINHGHRRFRAAKLADKTTIPAFLDNEIDVFGRFIENIQREDLSPLDIANQLNTFVKDGMQGKDIAEKIGKSDSWVSRHLGLLSAPMTIKKSLEDGKIKSVEAAKTLASLSNDHPVEVEGFLSNAEGEITQKQVREFSKELKNEKSADVALFDLESSTEEEMVKNKEEVKLEQVANTEIVYNSKSILIIEMLEAAQLTAEQKEQMLQELSDEERFDDSFNEIRFYLRQMDLDI